MGLHNFFKLFPVRFFNNPQTSPAILKYDYFQLIIFSLIIDANCVRDDQMKGFFFNFILKKKTLMYSGVNNMVQCKFYAHVLKIFEYDSCTK